MPKQIQTGVRFNGYPKRACRGVTCIQDHRDLTSIPSCGGTGYWIFLVPFRISRSTLPSLTVLLIYHFARDVIKGLMVGLR